jgi:hypothetical protein
MSCGTLMAQLTPEQRRNDFEQLAAWVAKAYAPYEWKRDALGIDAIAIRPWLLRAAEAPDDLAYFEVCAEYIASLRDLHSGFFVPSTFVAQIGMAADWYEGRALIDEIDRASLPAARFPFQIGDEVLRVDGVTAEEWTARISRLQSFANPESTRRWALDQWFYRAQAVIPRAHEIGESARVEVLRRETGLVETYEIPWRKSGKPLLAIGPVPSPRSVSSSALPGTINYQIRRAPREKRLRGFGSLRPAFTMPANYVLRFGSTAGDLIFSGSYESEGRRIGFLRIPVFPSGFSGIRALQQLAAEVAWFRVNTDVLVVDVMRNPGGDVCTTNEMLRYLIPFRFITVTDEFRPTLETIEAFRARLEDALLGGDPVEILFIQEYLKHVETAYREFRGRTGPIPACGFDMGLEPARDFRGNLLAYDKPLLVLIDGFSTSSADVFPAILQDAGRALLFGRPTAGGGGIPVGRVAGVYGEASVDISSTLGIRPKEVTVPGLPPTVYLENVGAWPDIEASIMTEENLLRGGQPFVESFTQVAVRLAAAGTGLPVPTGASIGPGPSESTLRRAPEHPTAVPHPRY